MGRTRALLLATGVLLLLTAPGCSGTSVTSFSPDAFVPPPARTFAQREVRPAEVADSLQMFIEGVDSTLAPLLRTEHTDLEALYRSNGYAPIWTEGARPTTSAHDALAALNQAADDGLNPGQYHVAAIDGLIARLDAELPPRPEDVAAFDAVLSAGLLRYLRHLHLGRVDPRAIGFRLTAPIDRHDFAALVRAAAADGTVLETVTGLRPEHAQYEALRRVLVRSRALAADARIEPLPAGRTRQLELALERIRWLPHATGQRSILVNIPMFRMWVWDAGSAWGPPALSLDVIVGRALSTQTPLFVEEMREVIFRPYWNIPSSILRNEILPKIKRDPDYLRRNDMEIVGEDSGGVPRIRQRPGPRNSLGLIKFVFPNQENVYMHGTPAQELFSRSRRDFSHGCVRVSDPVALAEWALADQPEWSRERILTTTAGAQTIPVKLTKPIQVILFYTTAVVSPEDGTLRFADDIYRHDVRLDRALAAAADR